MTRHNSFVVIAVALLILLASCAAPDGGAQDQSAAPTEAQSEPTEADADEEPAATEAPVTEAVEVTEEPAPYVDETKPDEEAVAVEEIIVTFSDETCTFDSPPVLAAGEVTVILDNQTDLKISADVARIEGASWQDLQEYLGEPGSDTRMPDWAPVASGRPVISNTAAKIYTLEPGSYGITCIAFLDSGNLANYPAGPFWIE